MADDPLLPEIGTLGATRDAVECTLLALTQRRPAGSAVDPVGDDAGMADLVVALVNMTALLARMLAGTAARAGLSLDAEGIVRLVGEHGEVRAARRVLDALGDGFPFGESS